MNIYCNEDTDEIFKSNRERISVIEMFKREEYIPRIVFYQNIACNFDINNQFYPSLN